MPSVYETLCSLGQPLNLARDMVCPEDLAGSVVVLVFWSRTSADSVAVARAVEATSRRFEGRSVVTLGIHELPHAALTDRHRVRHSLIGHGLTMPVLLDDRGFAARALSVQHPPAVVVLDASGTVAARLTGEAIDTLLHSTLSRLTAATPKSTRTPLVPDPELWLPSPTRLCWPSAVFAQTPSVGRDGFVFIADTGNRRVLICTWPDARARCSVLRVIDGLTAPRGLAFDPIANMLYLSDAEQHMVFRCQVPHGPLEPLAGTSKPGRDLVGGKSGTHQPLCSPTGLAFDPSRKKLFVAMSGLHQIWSLDLATLVARPVAGSGVCAVFDGAGESARCAQPVGLALHPDRSRLSIADHDGPALRLFDINTRSITTMAGVPTNAQGATLSIRGLRDGLDARMQNPSGLTLSTDGTLLLFTDTDNDCVRRLELSSGHVAPFLRASLRSPQGVHAAARLPATSIPSPIFIADSGNHRVAWCDATGAGLADLLIGRLPDAGDAAPRIPKHVERAVFNIPPLLPVTIEVGCILPSGARISTQESRAVRVSVVEPGDVLGEVIAQHVADRADEHPIRIAIDAADMLPNVRLLVEHFVAVEYGHSTRCVPHAAAWLVRLGSDGGEPRLISRVPDLSRSTGSDQGG